jgi:hypothetical protein
MPGVRARRLSAFRGAHRVSAVPGWDGAGQEGANRWARLHPLWGGHLLLLRWIVCVHGVPSGGQPDGGGTAVLSRMSARQLPRPAGRARVPPVPRWKVWPRPGGHWMSGLQPRGFRRRGAQHSLPGLLSGQVPGHRGGDGVCLLHGRHVHGGQREPRVCAVPCRDVQHGAGSRRAVCLYRLPARLLLDLRGGNSDAGVHAVSCRFVFR